MSETAPSTLPRTGGNKFWMRLRGYFGRRPAEASVREAIEELIDESETGFGDTGYGADLNGRGCACSTSDEGRGGTGPWSGLLALGLLGFVRRRRA